MTTEETDKKVVIAIVDQMRDLHKNQVYLENLVKQATEKIKTTNDSKALAQSLFHLLLVCPLLIYTFVARNRFPNKGYVAFLVLAIVYILFYSIKIYYVFSKI